MRLPQRRSDAGVTLVETLTAMMIVMIVMGIISGALYTVSRSEKAASERSDSQSTNRQGFELLTRLLRQATYPAQSTYLTSTIVSYAARDRIVFTSRRGAAVGAVPMRYEFQLSGSSLIWGSSAATCVGSAPCTYAAPTLDQTAARWIRNAVGGGPCPGAPADGAVFRYYSATASNGGALTELAVPASGYLTGAQLAAVASVGVELHTDVIPNRPAPGCEAITGLVVLRNRVLT